MLVGDEGVFFAVDEETRTPDLVDLREVVEPLGQQSRSDASEVVFCDCFDGGERRDECESSALEHCGEVTGWSRSDRPAHHEDVFGLEVHHFGNEQPDRFEVVQDLLFRG